MSPSYMYLLDYKKNIKVKVKFRKLFWNLIVRKCVQLRRLENYIIIWDVGWYKQPWMVTNVSQIPNAKIFHFLNPFQTNFFFRKSSVYWFFQGEEKENIVLYIIDCKHKHLCIDINPNKAGLFEGSFFLGARGRSIWPPFTFPKELI